MVVEARNRPSERRWACYRAVRTHPEGNMLPIVPSPPPANVLSIQTPARPLTPEEDAIGDPDDEESDVDDTLPADLWF
jgi:hypothetical protein